MSEWSHLARRFFSSVRARPPEPEREAWLREMLTTGERDLYERQSPQDRRHSIQCATYVAAELGDGQREAIVASALHDVGKADAELGTLGRVGATVTARLVGDERVRRWTAGSGLRARIGRYADHDRRGAELLARAGSSALAVAWAREHHWSASATSIDADRFWLLRRADHS